MSGCPLAFGAVRERAEPAPGSSAAATIAPAARGNTSRSARLRLSLPRDRISSPFVGFA
jgi:hypothetical protein